MMVLALGLALGCWMFYLSARGGQFTDLEARFAAAPETGECTKIPGLPGAEDLTIDRVWNVALISSDDRRAGPDGPNGGIYRLDLSKSAAAPEPELLTASFEGPFHPHGLSLYRGATTMSEATLFVVNHARGQHTIELFDWNGRTLKHTETVSGDALISPNDVVGIGPREFYATNDHGTSNPRLALLADLTLRKTASVVHWDGEEVRQVVDSLAYANGINVSPDGLELFVAQSSGTTIERYLRDAETGALEYSGQLEIGVGGDNIEVDSHGKLWVAAHPKTMTFLRHASDPSVLSPSIALWVDPDKYFDPPVRDAWVDDGSRLSAASVVAPIGSRLVIGSVFDPHVLICERTAD